MKRLLIMLVLPVVGWLLIIGSGSVHAQTKDEATACRQIYGGKNFLAGSNLLKDFQKSKCANPQKGSCFAKILDGDARQVVCGAANSNKDRDIPNSVPPVNSVDGSDNGAAVAVQANCSNRNNICLEGVPTVGSGETVIESGLKIAIGIIAAISVLFIVIGGMRYVLSQGDPQGVSKAKSTIVYALVGLVVAILAQGIILIVIKAVT